MYIIERNKIKLLILPDIINFKKWTQDVHYSEKWFFPPIRLIKQKKEESIKVEELIILESRTF